MRCPLYWLLAVSIAVPCAEAHPALYHYLEVNLHEPGKVRVYVTLHAPELSDTVAPLEEDVFGADWLASRSDEVIAELVSNGHRFAGEKFDFALGERVLKVNFTFPGAEEIRHPPADTEVPAGCFSGVGVFLYTADEQNITLNFTEESEKRLMLVINRPAAFPEVFDMEPGSQNEIALPPAPIEGENSETNPEQRVSKAILLQKTPMLSLAPYLLLLLLASSGIALWRFKRR